MLVVWLLKGDWNGYSVTNIEESTFHKLTESDRNTQDTSGANQIIPFTVRK